MTEGAGDNLVRFLDAAGREHEERRHSTAHFDHEEFRRLWRNAADPNALLEHFRQQWRERGRLD